MKRQYLLNSIIGLLTLAFTNELWSQKAILHEEPIWDSQEKIIVEKDSTKLIEVVPWALDYVQFIDTSLVFSCTKTVKQRVTVYYLTKDAYSLYIRQEIDTLGGTNQSLEVTVNNAKYFKLVESYHEDSVLNYSKYVQYLPKPYSEIYTLEGDQGNVVFNTTDSRSNLNYEFQNGVLNSIKPDSCGGIYFSYEKDGSLKDIHIVNCFSTDSIYLGMVVYNYTGFLIEMNENGVVYNLSKLDEFGELVTEYNIDELTSDGLVFVIEFINKRLREYKLEIRLETNGADLVVIRK